MDRISRRGFLAGLGASAIGLLIRSPGQSAVEVVGVDETATSIRERFHIKIDDEIMEVVATGPAWTVLRGVEGTVPAPHFVGARVNSLAITMNGVSGEYHFDLV